MVTTVTDMLPEHLRLDPATREGRLASAYKALVQGNAGRDDVEMVLVDLAIVSGYYNVTVPGTSNGDVQRAEGARSVYARIVYMASLPEEIMAAYMRALTAESTHMNEG